MDGFDDDGGSDNEAMPDFNDQTAATLVDTTADFDAEMQQFILPDRDPEPTEERVDPTPAPETPHAPLPTADEENVEEEETAEWKSIHQLTVYRNYAKEIEDSVIKHQGIELRKGRKRKRHLKDRDVFKIGRKDAEKINVKAARIEEGKDIVDVQGAQSSPTV